MSDSRPGPTGTTPSTDDRAPTTLELHSGLVFGFDPTVPATWRRDGEDDGPGPAPRVVLEDLIAEVMRTGPTVVRFSGGRDSSLVLAVAAHVARRDGYDLPTAVTVRYPSVRDAYESQWQDLVVDRLAVPHEVVEVAAGEDEIAGPLGVAQLLRSGPFIPPTSGVTLGRIGPMVAGRTVLSGQGGDEVLGESRISAFVAHWRRRRAPTREAAGGMGHQLLPRPVRRIAATRDLATDHPAPWLRPEARRLVERRLVEQITDSPWDWRTSRWDAHRARLWAVGSTNLARVASLEGFALSDPLLDPRFVRAMCRVGGPFGLATRTEAMRLLAGDLLPLRLLRRPTKASFDNVYAGRRAREFAESWDGGGVDPALVDVERLRSAWRSEHIPVTSLAPLQLALLHAARGGWVPEESPEPLS